MYKSAWLTRQDRAPEHVIAAVEGWMVTTFRR